MVWIWIFLFQEARQFTRVRVISNLKFLKLQSRKKESSHFRLYINLSINELPSSYSHHNIQISISNAAQFRQPCRVIYSFERFLVSEVETLAGPINIQYSISFLPIICACTSPRRTSAYMPCHKPVRVRWYLTFSRLYPSCVSPHPIISSSLKKTSLQTR